MSLYSALIYDWLLASSFFCLLLIWTLEPESESESEPESESESYITAEDQSASLSWNKPRIWGLRTDFYYCQTVAGLLIWGALSDERACLLFTIAAGPGQHSHSRVRVPWDSRSYFTISDNRLPFSSPPTTRRATVEVFDPASTRGLVSIWTQFCSPLI
jgi:hypothetical protein